jgi:GT2 family glycosyltransferase
MLKKSSKDPKVSVIILNYNRPQYTIECVQSVLLSNYSSLEIIVIDNCSEYLSFASLKEKLKALDVRLIRTDQNKGYAGGNNFGILQSNGKYILLLNDDVTIDNELITRLVSLAEKNDSVGIIGPVTYRYKTNETWFYPSDISKTKHEILDVSIVIGAALMIKREALLKIGLLDENFFMYHEEWDWCVRAKCANYRVVLAPQLCAFHNVQDQNTYFAPHFAFYYHRNYFLFAAKHCEGFGEIFSFLFTKLVWNKGKLPALYPILALKKGKPRAFRAYLMGVTSGITILCQLRMSK